MFPTISLGSHVDPGTFGKVFHAKAMDALFPRLFTAMNTLLWRAEQTRVNYAKRIDHMLRKLRHPRSQQPLYHPIQGPTLVRGVLANPEIATAVLRGSTVPEGTPPELAAYITEVSTALVRAGPMLWAEFPQEFGEQLYRRSMEQSLGDEPPARQP